MTSAGKEAEERGPLTGQAALVTGCGRMQGIGRATALALAGAGADVVISDLVASGVHNIAEADDSERAAGWQGLDSLKAEIEALGRRAAVVTGDVSQFDDAERMVAAAIAAMGRLDILVNNAGAPHGADRGWSWEVPEDAFDKVMRINAKGVFLMSTAMVRHLVARAAPGRIVNIASGAGKRGYPKRAAYCASKFAVIGLTQSMAEELGERGITVNAVCPGPIATARQASRQGQAVGAIRTPVQRLGTPQDVARAVLFLVEPTADYLTGQALNVDGGLLM